MKSLISNAIRAASNIPGFSTKRKLVIIESDDWGSIRMPSLKALERLEHKGLNMRAGDSERYNLNDTLASKEDLSALFEVLGRHKDSKGNPACFTALSLPSNPNFEKIKESGYSEYFNEPFTETLERYGQHDALEMWKFGEKEKLFIPEYHGREHLNVVAWMRSLKRGDKETMLAFNEGLWAFSSSITSKVSFQAPYDVEYPDDITEQVQIIQDGLQIFEKVHGRKARFFVPPNGKIHSSVENATAQGGIRYISSSKIHTEVLGEGKTRKHFRYIGKKNKLNQVFLTRNAFFEPNQGRNKDHVDSCLKEIEIAFKYNKPAVICTHRCNYIGSLSENNRWVSLKALDRLLINIKKNWLNVEFIHSNHLGKITK